MPPTANGGDFNRYGYAKDNPYRYTDPEGLISQSDEDDCAVYDCSEWVSPTPDSSNGGGDAGNPQSATPATPSTQSAWQSNMPVAATFLAGLQTLQYGNSASTFSALVAPSGQLSYQLMTSLVAANNESQQPNALIIAISWMESSFIPSAHAKAPYTATGLMGITRGAASNVGYPYWVLNDPAANIRAGSAYFQLRIQWASGNVQAALSGYGTGTEYAERVMQAAYGLESPLTNGNPLHVLQTDLHP